LELMERISAMLPSIGLKRDERSFEIFLQMYVTARDFYEIES